MLLEVCQTIFIYTHCPFIHLDRFSSRRHISWIFKYRDKW